MKTENLLKISLVVSITGILILLFLANTLPQKLIEINEINNKLLNKKVKIIGSVFKIEDKESFKILSVADETGKIDVLCECDGKIEEFQKIEVIGKVSEYNQYLQIQADQISKI